MSARLETNVAGIALKTPILGASGTFGFGLEYRDFLDLAKVGGVVSKGITPSRRAGNPGVRIAETASGMLNSIGLENPGMDAFIRDIVPEAVRMPTPFIVNFSAGSVEEFGEMAAKLERSEVDGMEVNISCPNVKAEGIFFGTKPQLAADVTRAVKRATTKPVIVKLSPNVTDIKEIASAVEEAGADAVSLINTLTGMAIDIRTRKPLLGNVTGGLSGPCIKPVALRMVYEVAQTVKIPVFGMGGITTAEDVVEFLLAGASAVQVGAESFRNPRAVVEIAEELDHYLEAQGISSVRELVGALEVCA